MKAFTQSGFGLLYKLVQDIIAINFGSTVLSNSRRDEGQD